jgi:hypothetical protein
MVKRKKDGWWVILRKQHIQIPDFRNGVEKIEFGPFKSEKEARDSLRDSSI